MSEHSIRRVVGGVSAFAIAAGFAVVTGSGVAQAASGTVDWWDGNSHFTRTVSNTTPAEGDVVTVSTKFERKAWTTLEILYGVKDVHAPCLTYVEGSAKVDGSPRGLDSQGADFAKVAGSWTVYPNIDPKSHTFEFSYKVGPDCARDTALQSGMHYSGSLGSGTYDNKGPAITVGKNASTTTLAGVTSAETGTAVTLSATVTGGANGDTVEFFDGAAKVGSGTLNNGVATASWTPTAGGAHALTAKYLGSARANGSTSAVQNVTVSVPNVATTTTVSGPATVVEGEAVTLTAQVAPTPAGGTVQFKDGATDLGAPATVGADGKATLSLPSLAAGAHQVTAVYSGVAGFAGSTSAPFTVTSSVPDVATTTTLTAPATADEGQEVTLTAAVSPAPAGGTVQFKAGGVDLGAPVAVTNGSASINQTLAVGAHELTAVYSGAPGFVASVSAARTLTVSTVVVPDVQTTTTLTAPATADEGQEVTLTAAVSPAPAGGTVQFKAGGVDLGAPVAVTNGSASINQTLAVGAHELTAVYSGAPGFVASVSAARTLTVSTVVAPDKATTTTLTVPAAARTGEAVHLFASVAGPDLASIGSVGTVEFTVDGQALAPVNVVDGVADLTHTFASAGTASVEARFSGGTGFSSSAAQSASVSVTDPDPTDVATTTALDAPAGAVRGTTVTLTATVSPTPAGGTVQFFDGTNRIGLPVAVTGGTATRSWVVAVSGSRQITAVYSGAPGHLGSTSTVSTVLVTDPPVNPGEGSTGSLDNIFGS